MALSTQPKHADNGESTPLLTPSTATPASVSSVGNASENHAIAELLSEIARLLSDQGASEFRIHAYQNASKMLSEREQPVREVVAAQGLAGLVSLPTIGHSIANVIDQYLRLGHIHLLDRLRGEENAEHTFSTLPNIGQELAHRIHDYLHIESLPELYAAAADGRLAKVPGMGRKRIQAVRECLTTRLQHRQVLRTGPNTGNTGRNADHTDRTVSVEEILSLDGEYRQLASEGRLPKIAPRQFNPGNLAWLPILHTERDTRHYTALYSNSARAHELNTTKDWVVIYRDDPQSHGRWTVITSQFGKLKGCRIVRGREDECLELYRKH